MQSYKPNMHANSAPNSTLSTQKRDLIQQRTQPPLLATSSWNRGARRMRPWPTKDTRHNEAKIKRPMYMDRELFIRYETVTLEYGQGCTGTHSGQILAAKWHYYHHPKQYSQYQRRIDSHHNGESNHRSAPHKCKYQLKTSASAFNFCWNWSPCQDSSPI